jgi:hypothetical protein
MLKKLSKKQIAIVRKGLGTPTRTSAKQKLAAYQNAALDYIGRLRNPSTQSGFSVTAYSVSPTGKKPNVISVPELGAIVGTARQLGSEVRVSFVGRDDDTKVVFEYVSAPASIPVELLQQYDRDGFII